MDLLASYEDDGENSQTPDNKPKTESEIFSVDSSHACGVPPPVPSLQSEWESFEKLVGGSAFAGGDTADTVPSTSLPDKGLDGISMEEDQEPVFPYRTSLSRSPSRSRSRSHSSGSGSSSRSSSAGSAKGDKEGHSGSSSSDEETGESRTLDEGNAVEKAKGKDTTPDRSPPILRRERSNTPIETSKSKPRSRSKSSERKKPDRHRSKSRSRSRERHGGSSHRRRRHRSRSREKGRSRGSRSKHHRRSRSRDHHRRSRRRKSRSRNRSHDRSRRRRRHRSRSRGGRGAHRSPYERRREDKPSGFRGPETNKPTFKEKMRQQLMKASKLLTQQAAAGQIPPDGQTPLDCGMEKPSPLPLMKVNTFPNMNPANAATVTPQIALLQTMAVMHQKAQEMTGIAVPKYYNPAAVNPLKYAEQVQKRKLLWSKSKEKKEDTEAMWQATDFNADQDGKVAAKFRKLMGMKEGEGEGETTGKEGVKPAEDINKKQQELFQTLDRQYEFARMTTHTHRGIGLGFQSQGMPDT